MQIIFVKFHTQKTNKTDKHTVQETENIYRI